MPYSSFRPTVMTALLDGERRPGLPLDQPSSYCRLPQLPAKWAWGYCQLNEIQTVKPIDGFIPFFLGYGLGTHHLMPFTQCSRAKLTIVHRSRQVSTQSEQIANHTIHGNKALRLPH